MKRRVAIAVAGTLLTGCYTLQPVASSKPLLGTQIAVDVNDAGRAVLGGTMGPEIGQVEGRLVQLDTAGYLLSVSVVHFLRGGEQSWTGERVRIKSEFVSTVREKKFSRSRTALISAVALGGVAAFVSQTIIGAGKAEPDKLPGDSTAQSIRIPWH
jgi:hypothetical protein